MNVISLQYNERWFFAQISGEVLPERWLRKFDFTVDEGKEGVEYFSQGK